MRKAAQKMRSGFFVVALIAIFGFWQGGILAAKSEDAGKSPKTPQPPKSEVSAPPAAKESSEVSVKESEDAADLNLEEAEGEGEEGIEEEEMGGEKEGEELSDDENAEEQTGTEAEKPKPAITS